MKAMAASMLISSVSGSRMMSVFCAEKPGRMPTRMPSSMPGMITHHSDSDWRNTSWISAPETSIGASSPSADRAGDGPRESRDDGTVSGLAERRRPLSRRGEGVRDGRSAFAILATRLELGANSPHKEFSRSHRRAGTCKDESRPMTHPQAAGTVPDLLGSGRDDAPAIAAPGRRPTSFAELRTLADRTAESLNALGVGRNDRVAIVLPNGPAMAAAFVTIAAGATTAPLNPSYRAEEYDFYLGDLDAKALVVERGSASRAIAVAARRGVPVVELVEDEATGAGLFRLEATGPTA